MNLDTFEKANFYANMSFLAVFVVAATTLLVRFRFRLENSTYFVILSYFFTIGPRVLLQEEQLY